MLLLQTRLEWCCQQMDCSSDTWECRFDTGYQKAEGKIPGGQVGPTLACILGLTWQRVRDGDRFWFEHPHVFTYNQRAQLKKTSLSKVICDNADDIPRVQRNAFRSDQPRVACSSLPTVNLRHWRDRRCSRYNWK